MRVKLRHFALCFVGALIFARSCGHFEGVAWQGVLVAKLACICAAQACWYFALRSSAVTFGQEVQDECNRLLRQRGSRFSFTWTDGNP